MPSERRRALRWGRAVLQKIANDPGVPAELAAEVVEVLAVFPDDRAVATCFLEQDDELLQQHLATIEASQEILAKACRSPELGDQTRFAAATTDRHFPQPWEMSKAPGQLPPRDWVELYLLRDLSVVAMRQELLQLGITDIERVCERLTRSGTPVRFGRPVQYPSAS
jgi:hypothetical protein